LRVEWGYSAQLHDAATIERLADDFNAALVSLVAHCRTDDAGGFTPSDFPLANLDMDKLSKLSSLLDAKG
jgi:non-ribosomal peptide synthase protein (TIGR01720 family)